MSTVSSEPKPRPQTGLIQLGTALPLAAPLSLLVDPANACNFKCSFCPTGNKALLKEIGRPKGLMPLGLFRKIIDDLAAFPKPVKSLLLYKDGEPLLNKELPEMIRYARRSGCVERISLTTNGALLSESWAADLVEAGPDAVRISVEHVSNDGYRKVTGTYSDYGSIVANVARLYQASERAGGRVAINAKIVDFGLSEAEKSKFVADFKPISHSLNIDSPMGWSNTRSMDCLLGSKPATGIDGHTPLNPARVVCPSPFKSLAINFNGEASVCCVDWSHQTVVGDVSREPLGDIWQGHRLRQFRLAHLKGQRASIPPCSGCQYIEGFEMESDLDAWAAGLVPLFEAETNGA